LVVDLIRSDRAENSGLRTYIDQMMAVMAFDAERRGRLISQEELTAYTRSLAGRHRSDALLHRPRGVRTAGRDQV